MTKGQHNSVQSTSPVEREVWRKPKFGEIASKTSQSDRAGQTIVSRCTASAPRTRPEEWEDCGRVWTNLMHDATRRRRRASLRSDQQAAALPPPSRLGRAMSSANHSVPYAEPFQSALSDVNVVKAAATLGYTCMKRNPSQGKSRMRCSFFCSQVSPPWRASRSLSASGLLPVWTTRPYAVHSAQARGCMYDGWLEDNGEAMQCLIVTTRERNPSSI